MADYQHHWFSYPVRVWTKPGRSRGIATVEDAAVALLEDWPEEWKAAAKAREARKSCLLALQGAIKPDDARKRFIDAAKEAHILDFQKR